MTDRHTEASPRFKARLAGLAYLLTIVFAPLAMFVRGKLVVPGDAQGTAANILAHTGLYRLGFASDLLAVVAYIVVTVLFYELFRPVSRTISLLAAAISLTASAISAVALPLQLAPLTLLHGDAYLKTFSAQQLDSLALLTLKMAGVSVNAGIVFFGFYCVLIGYLIFRSTFLPRLLGAGMVLAGLGWLSFLYAPLGVALAPFNQISGGLGEGALTLFLLIAGLDAARWQERNGQPRLRDERHI